MKLLVEKIPDLQGLYLKELRLLLSAEEMVAIKAQVMAQVARDPDLMPLFRKHIEETEVQATHLREILIRAAGHADPLKCKVVYTLFDEVEDLVQDAVHASVRDAALISEAQRVVHYEMAGYRALRRFARTLDLEEDSQLLNQSLHQKEQAVEQLAFIADRIYPVARNAPQMPADSH